MIGVQSISNALLWMVIAAIPFQGMPILTCGCALPSGQASAEAAAPDQLASCCGKSQPAPVAKPSKPLACCQDSSASTERACSCGLNCRCKERASTPKQKALPIEHRTSADELAIGSLLALSMERGDIGSPQRHGLEVTCPLGADRCALLCRFLL